MKTIRQLLLVSIISMVILSCKDDYLNEVNDAKPIESSILVSPDWNFESYPIVLREANNATYTITNVPEWLKIESVTEQFNNGTAHIICSAIPITSFSAAAIYNATMMLEVDQLGSYIVKVGYINAGKPNIDCTISNELGTYGDQSELNISNTTEGILLWQITEYPKWISISDSIGITHSYSRNNVRLMLNPKYPLMTNTTGKIVLTNNSTNNTTYTIDISYHAGNPRFSCYTSLIDFERTATKQSVTFNNNGNGVLTWQIENWPTWLTVSEIEGSLSRYGSKDITFTCDRAALGNGNHTELITILTNDKEMPRYQITVKCRVGTGNSENITAIEGTVIDAEYDRSSDLLYLVTQAPNKLQVYDTKTSSFITNISLDKAPTCISIADDGQKAAVGHGGKITYINLVSKTVIKTHIIDFTVVDIVLNDDNWCCLISGSNNPLQWLNMDNGAEYFSTGWLEERSVIKKIPGKNTIIASRYGVMLFDIESKEMVKSFYESSIYSFWLSTDGEYLFDTQANVYRTPSVSTNKMQSIGKLQDINSSYYNRVIWFDHCPVTNSVWAIENQYDWDSHIAINQYEATDYTYVKSYFYDDYHTTINGITDIYATSPHYIFANNNGTDIFAIKNVIEKHKANAWSLERIPVTQNP